MHTPATTHSFPQLQTRVLTSCLVCCSAGTEACVWSGCCLTWRLDDMAPLLRHIGATGSTGCGVLCSTDNGLGYLLVALSTFMVD